MTSLQEIESAIEKLPREEFFELVRHLRKRHAVEWDRQIEQDAKNGQLDRLWEKAEKEIQEGGLRPLDQMAAQVSAWRATESIESRAKRADFAAFDRVMAKVPKVPPMKGDELPPGYKCG